MLHFGFGVALSQFCTLPVLNANLGYVIDQELGQSLFYFSQVNLLNTVSSESH